MKYIFIPLLIISFLAVKAQQSDSSKTVYVKHLKKELSISEEKANAVNNIIVSYKESLKKIISDKKLRLGSCLHEQ